MVGNIGPPALRLRSPRFAQFAASTARRPGRNERSPGQRSSTQPILHSGTAPAKAG